MIGEHRTWSYSKYQIFTLTLINDKILDWSKFKAFEMTNYNVNDKLILDLERIINIVAKGKKMLVISNHSFSHNVFGRLSSDGC